MKMIPVVFIVTVILMSSTMSIGKSISTTTDFESINTAPEEKGEIYLPSEEIQTSSGCSNPRLLTTTAGISFSGHWRYQGEEGGNSAIGIKYCRVELFKNTLLGEWYVETTYTDENGYYEFTGLSASETYKTKVFSETHPDSGHNALEVTDGAWPVDSRYVSQTDWYQGNQNINTNWRVVGNLRGCYEISNNIVDTYDWLKDEVGWTRNRVLVNWPKDASKFCDSPLLNWIEIEDGDEWQRWVHIHEYGHAIMYEAYGNTFPECEDYDSHSLELESDSGFALIEGWAEFFSEAVDNYDSLLGLEFMYYADRNDDDDWDGNIVEGAVAAVFWDIFDGKQTSDYPDWSNCKHGDYVENSFDKIWEIIKKDNPDGMKEFWNHWVDRYGLTSDVYALFYHQRMKFLENGDLQRTDEEGTLSWEDVSPGSTVTAEIKIKNDGDQDTFLDWSIKNTPFWGTWEFDPGSGMIVGSEEITISISVVAPSYEGGEYTGTIKIQNSRDSSDIVEIDVSLKTSEGPHLKCSGNLQFSGEVKPGSELEGSFYVENDGGSGSELDWEVTEYPTCIEMSPWYGNNLKPSDERTEVSVTIFVTDEKEADFDSEIVVCNKNDPENKCTIKISYLTSKSVSKFNIIKNLFDRYSQMFPMLKLFLKL